MILVAFDIGGTFTDLVLFRTDKKELFVNKIPTTSGRPEEAVLSGITELFAQAGAAPADADTLFHATTIATNTILERKGSRTGLIATRGFRDILLIGRQKRYDTRDLYLDKPEPLTKRRYIQEVAERVKHDGSIHFPLDMDSVDHAVGALLDAGVESIAVALLHSYANDAHEKVIKERVHALAPEMCVSISSEVSAKYREYERTNTTTADAYVKPIVSRYLGTLKSALSEQGFTKSPFIMQSNGGVVSAELASEFPVRIIESGPAAGVLMCASVAKQEGFDHLLTFDMGGTTAKIGAVDHGEPALTSTFEVDAKNYRRYSGLPLNVQSIELIEIGAGGGSLADTDMGLIKVGPRSAGAVPGPICYGGSGTEPTVTDANLVLGYLNPDNFCGGSMTLDLDAAKEGIRRTIAEPMGLTVPEAAWGIHAVANSNMAAAMRVISVERGRDPGQCVMVAFGGAGPLHATSLARELGIPKVVIPKGAGVGSALGMLAADTRLDVSLTRILQLNDTDPSVIADIYDELERRARAEIVSMLNGREPLWQRYAYIRFKGQGSEVKVDLPSGIIDADYPQQVIDSFRAEYQKNFGYWDEDNIAESVDWQLVAILPTEASHLDFGTAPPPAQDSDPVVGIRPAYFSGLGGYTDTKIVDRYKIRPDTRIVGPAVIEEREATIVAMPGDVISLSEHDNLVISIAEEQSR